MAIVQRLFPVDLPRDQAKGGTARDDPSRKHRALGHHRRIIIEP